VGADSVIAKAVCTGLPALPFAVARAGASSLRCAHGFARSYKVAAHRSAVGSRGELVLHLHQLRPARQESTVPIRYRQRCACRREVQPREIRLALRLCLLMPDHLHAIIAFPRKPGMQTTVKNWKKFVAGKHGVDWQRDFFDHRLRDHHELEEKTSYILTNPVRKALCERAEDWAWIYRPNDRPPPRW